jgi:23S rRNA (pseudouridine1915-N3)-methyltransferase
MRFHLVAVGTRAPKWVSAGYEDYARRLHGGARLSLTEVPAARRSGRHDADRARGEEAKRLQAALPAGVRIIALDGGGRDISTEQLAARMKDWQRTGAEVAFVVGGPAGLDPSILAAADECWSLSAMTHPHMLVRVIIAEQLYRAQSMLHGHPYHR